MFSNETWEVVRCVGPWADMLGWKPEHLEALRARIHAEDRRHIARMVRLDTRHTYTRIEREHGGYVWLQWHSHVQDAYTCLAATEQTDMYSSLHTLREAEDRYTQMMLYSGHFWLVHDKEGQILEANPAILESLGYTLDELQHLHVYDIEMTIGQKELQRIWEQMPLNHTVTLSGRHRRKDATTYPVEMKLRKFTQGARTLLSVVGRDTSKDELVSMHLSALNAQLRHSKDRAVREKGLQNDFISAIAQSLSTPLSAIIGYAQMVREDLHDAPSSVHHLEQILISADQMGVLFDDLFELSTLQANVSPFEFMRVRAKDILQECEDTFGAQATSKGLKLDVHVDDDLELDVDVSKLRQALHIMLSNAIMYTKQGHVRVSMEQLNPYQVACVVEDTGRGFTEEQRDCAFEPFHPTQRAKIQARGKGLNLGICKLIFTRMGGELTLTSQHGEGARFEGIIPVKRSQMANLMSIEGASILVVSQHDAFMEQNRRTLRNVDAHVIEALDHYSALERARTLHPDVVLIHLDQDMDDADMLIRQLLTDPTTAHIPVIVRGVEHEHETLRRSGALIQLERTIPEKMVVHHIQRCLSTSDGHLVVASSVRVVGDIILKCLSPLHWEERGAYSIEQLQHALERSDAACVAVVDTALFDDEPTTLTRMLRTHHQTRYILLVTDSSTHQYDPEHIVMTRDAHTLGQLVRTVSRLMFELSA